MRESYERNEFIKKWNEIDYLLFNESQKKVFKDKENFVAYSLLKKFLIESYLDFSKQTIRLYTGALHEESIPVLENSQKKIAKVIKTEIKSLLLNENSSLHKKFYDKVLNESYENKEELQNKVNQYMVEKLLKTSILVPLINESRNVSDRFNIAYYKHIVIDNITNLATFVTNLQSDALRLDLTDQTDVVNQDNKKEVEQATRS